jgi:hypothetical protein
MFLTLDDIARQLPEELNTAHYHIRYGYRYRCPGTGLGVRGVRGQGMLTAYVDGMERLYRSMVSREFNRLRKPKTDASSLVRVLVFDLRDYLLGGDGSPFTARGKDDVRTIALPCRNAEPLLQSCLNRAAADAVHEATHVFNYAARPRGVKDGSWEWFNEATAVYMEARVLPGNLESIYFLMDWNDRPEVPLDVTGYQGAMFVQYLVERYSAQLLTDLWEKSEPGEKPLEALARLSDDSPETKPPALTDCAVFADYCLHAYFTCDQNSRCFRPEVYARYGWRMVSEGFQLSTGESASVRSSLDHLSCRYYRVELRPGANSLRCRLRSLNPSGGHLSAQIALVRRDLRREGAAIQFLPVNGELAADCYPAGDGGTDHLVVQVANSALYENGAEFELELEAA